MRKRIILLSALGIALLLLGCTARVQVGGPQPITAERVRPAAEIALGEEGKVDIKLGLVNETDQPLVQKDDFVGQWVLLNSAGEVRASGRLYTAGPLDPNESAFPLTWSAALESGTYTLKWGAPSVGTTIVGFQVQKEDLGVGVGALRQQTTDQFLIDQAEN